MKALEQLEILLKSDQGEETLSEIMSRIEREMQRDDEPYSKKGAAIVKAYLNGNTEQREIIDTILMALCGWTFETIVKRVLKIRS